MMEYFKKESSGHTTFYRVQNAEVQYWAEHKKKWTMSFLFGRSDVLYYRGGVEVSKLEVLLLCGAKAVEE